jgi:hypothetical protein
VTLKAQVLSMTEGEGVRWAVTQNLVATGGTVPDAFLKRIDASGEPVSKQLPPNADPVGPVVVGFGIVWVPVRDGVLQYHTDLTLFRTLPLPPADHRSVAAFPNEILVTAGNTVQNVQLTAGIATLRLTVPTPVLDIDPRNGRWLTDDGTTAAVGGLGATEPRVVLPTGFRAERFASSPTGLAVSGAVGGEPALVLLRAHATEVRATVVLPRAGDDAALAWNGRDVVSVVTGGNLYEVTVP